MEFGSGMPKICVPIMGETLEEIELEAQKVKSLPADLVEWRADWFCGIHDEERLLKALGRLRRILGEKPLLFTFRTREEGGEGVLAKESYKRLIETAAKSGLADLADVELYTMREEAGLFLKRLHQHGIKIILSSHDFQKTPAREEMVSRLREMQSAGADLAKLAVMPKTKKDVLALLEATLEMEQYPGCPVATMSMSSEGFLSRITGEFTGSALTFGAGTKASAPGQIEAEKLGEVLQMMHRFRYAH